MSALETYANAALQTKGTEHMHAIDSLRRYIHLTPVEDLVKYIYTLTSQDILRTLIEAGMPKEAWRAAVNRTERLREQQGGGAI